MDNMLNFLFIHGSWHGSWVWDDIKSELLEKSFNVSCPNLTGLGERKHLISNKITIDTFINDVENHIMYQEIENLVLIGHSFAGSVLSGLADKIKEKIKLLIYFDSIILLNGETSFDALPKTTVEERIQLSKNFDNGISIPVPSAESFGIYDIKQSLLLQKKLTPMPLSSFQSKLNLKNDIGNGLPLCYIKCKDPIYKPLELSRKRVEEFGWPTYNLNAGHDGMVSHPHDTINLLYKILSEQLKLEI